ncbi:M23 family metallopeptidase [Natrinema salaciae]|uniref:Peptidase family M23 n=1 Tax=Natrinema salaciae TaxID=1186196 RepID=A0A1H9NZX4_9EURY|nr:M23 family metallopeptidase [Natrinema salaciae]SER41490.1 Peptidase family M23 [Natrinema salaciae]
MADRTTGATESSDGQRSLWSLPRRAVLWMANLNFWVVFGGFSASGLLVMRTETFDSLALVFFLLAGILPVVFQTIESDEEDGHGYAYETSSGEKVRYIVSALGWSITPWGILTQALQFGGQSVAMVRYRRRYPNRERYVPETDLALPFDGQWTVINGGVTEATSHSWMLVAQRYAYDFVITDEDGATHSGDGIELAEYHVFGKPIRSPAAGTVVKTKDCLRDYPRPGGGWLEWRTWDIRGNHVVIKHAGDEYSLLAHLREGSVSVSPGDHVERGEVIGECGNSGHSGEPHLHFQLQDRPNFWTAASLVPRFQEVSVLREDDRRNTHEFYRSMRDEPSKYLWAGDHVSNRD